MKDFLRVFLVLWIGVAAAADDCDLDCTLTTLLREEKIAGAVYSLVQGEETRVGAVGLANHATGAPMKPDSKVHIGSVTKTLTALGALKLVTEGRVGLDTPVRELLPEILLLNPWEAKSPVTLRHFLDHTSGLDDLHLWHLFTAHAPPRAPLEQALARPADLLRVRVEPGTRMSYSNLGFTIAAMVIEARTGERYESWLDRELLGPLGMRDSTFEFVSQEGAEADPRLAWGHHDDLSPAAAMPVWVRPAAQFTTTAADMAMLARFLMSDGRVDDAQLVRSDLLREMGRPHSTEAARAGLEAGYALGLATRDRYGAIGRCHIGNIVGYRAVLCMYPDRKAFFIAQNTDSETANYSRFEEVLARELDLGRPASPLPEASAPEKPPSHWEGRYVAAPARFETFGLLDLLFDSLRLRENGGVLEVSRSSATTLRLASAGGNLYRAPNSIATSHVLMDDGGEVRFSNGLRTWRRVDGTTFALNWGSFALGLAGLLTLLVLGVMDGIRQRACPRQPAAAALALLLLTPPLFFFQPFTSIGDLTLASGSLYVATLALPVLMAWHLVWAWRRREQAWRLHGVAAFLVLQWCLSLWAWELLPLALWR